MQTAAFGTKTFEASSNRLYTPDGITISESLNIEMQAIEGKKPATHIKGLNEMKLGFSVKLDARSVDVLAEINFWLSTLRSKTPEFLSIGGKLWGTHKMLLVDVKVSGVQILPQNRYTNAELDLSFAEYITPGYAKQEGAAGKTAVSGTTSAPTVSSKKIIATKSTNLNAQQVKIEQTQKVATVPYYRSGRGSFSSDRGGGFTGAT